MEKATSYRVEANNGILDCGHKHRTIEGAIKCLDKLYAEHWTNGSWSACATWHDANIIDNDSEESVDWSAIASNMDR